ncbi:MAG: hypothetical protein P1U49_03640 [Minwuia sp.]|nr:hypothetical protein [Minwuia sp.]
MNHLIRLPAAIFATTLIVGCGPVLQETSGHDYIAKYRQDSVRSNDQNALKTIDRAMGMVEGDESSLSAARTNRTLNEMVVEAASVEPLLRFPARIGLARLDGLYRSDVPPAEASGWIAVAETMQDGIGELVPINHMLGDEAANSVGLNNNGWTAQQISIAKIRLAAARQHLDAVIIYRTQAESESGATFAAALDYTLVGTFLVPGHMVEAQSVATAVILDVRNGYMYGEVTETATKTRLTNYWSTRDAERSSSEAASVRAALKLAPAVGAVLEQMYETQLRKRAGLPS